MQKTMFAAVTLAMVGILSFGSVAMACGCGSSSCQAKSKTATSACSCGSSCSGKTAKAACGCAKGACAQNVKQGKKVGCTCGCQNKVKASVSPFLKLGFNR